MKLGDRVRCKITGLTGIAVCDATWLHGCRRITVQPEKLAQGKLADTVTFDENQLVLVKAGVVADGNHDTGGPRPEPTRY